MSPAAKEVQWPFIVNLANSIIGVSVLAMPFCLMQCGILLGSLLIVGSAILTRVTSHLLLKGAHIARRRSYELYSLHLFGSAGKAFIELMTVLYLLSTCCAFFVVIGDLGPHIVADFFGISTVTWRLRIFVMVLIGFWVVIPLSLLRNIDSLSSVSSLAIVFYGIFVVRMALECLPNLLAGNWFHEVNWWRPEGVLKCLPIIGLALSCQTNLFSTAEAMVEYSPARMDTIVSGAVNLCSSVYIAVGFFGYVSYFQRPIAGDVLVYLESSFITQLIKFAFVLSVAVSFPLMLFPCRSALFSMIQKQSHDLSFEVIPDVPFRLITLAMIFSTLLIAIMIPQVEFILGLTGSLIGSAVCIIGPSFMYLQIAPQHHFYSRIAAQVCMLVGFFILIVCTYATLHDTENSSEVHVDQPMLDVKTTNSVLANLNAGNTVLISLPKASDGLINAAAKEVENPERKEPPLPQEDSEVQIKHDPAEPLKDKGEANKEKEFPVEKDSNDVKQAAQLVQELKKTQEESKNLLQEQKKLIDELKEQKNEQQALKEQVPVPKQPEQALRAQENFVLEKPVTKALIPPEKHNIPLKIQKNENIDEMRNLDNFQPDRAQGNIEQAPNVIQDSVNKANDVPNNQLPVNGGSNRLAPLLETIPSQRIKRQGGDIASPDMLDNLKALSQLSGGQELAEKPGLNNVLVNQGQLKVDTTTPKIQKELADREM